MNKEIIDIEDVMERVQDDYELFMELLEIFQDDYTAKQKQLLTAIEKKDSTQIKDLVHSIKGATGNISATSMHRLCEEIESLIEKNDMDAVKKAFTTLEEHFVDVQACIVELKEKNKNNE